MKQTPSLHRIQRRTNQSLLTSAVTSRERGLRLLDSAPVALFAVVLLVFGLMSDKFLTAAHFTQILVQSSSTAVVAVGMTCVLLTAGVDLSVGAIMFVGAGLAGKMALGGQPLSLCLLVMLGGGLLGGAVNALLVTRLKLVAFIATLATLYIGRGLGRWVTQTRAINLPDSFLALGSARWFGVPLPLWIAGAGILPVPLCVLPISALRNQGLDLAQRLGGHRELTRTCLTGFVQPGVVSLRVVSRCSPSPALRPARRRTPCESISSATALRTRCAMANWRSWRPRAT